MTSLIKTVFFMSLKGIKRAELLPYEIFIEIQTFLFRHLNGDSK